MIDKKKLQVWWVPQVPCESFVRDVESVEQAVFLLDTLAAYDHFQYKHNIKPDFCNAGGLRQWCEDNDEWEDWYDEATGTDDPREFLALQGKGDTEDEAHG